MSEEYNLVNDDFLNFELIFHDFCIKMCYFADFSHDNVVPKKTVQVYTYQV